MTRSTVRSSPMQTIAIEPLLMEPPRVQAFSPDRIASCDESTLTELSDVNGFFVRNGLGSRVKEACHLLARSLYPDVETRPLRSQGYCSYTMAVSTNYLLQFRTEEYQLDIKVCEEARSIFGSLVPRVQYLGCVPMHLLGNSERPIHVYTQERIPGVTLKEFQKMGYLDNHMQQLCRRRLVEDLAKMFAVSLHHGRSDNNNINGAGDDNAFNKGLVGRSLRWRLGILKALPNNTLRERVDHVTSSIDRVEALPWCLTHGDLVPANIMIDPETGHLTGLIDWAEGEWLPFGIGLYGLEEVLGYEDAVAGFRFYEDHKQLRKLFWNRLMAQIEIKEEASWFRDAELSRTLGVLLWRGIAFEDGRIDRIVEPGRDDFELQKLSLFLAGPSRLKEGQTNNSTVSVN